MSTSILKLYKNSKITPARNARVDDIEVYLDSLEGTYTSSKFQYLRIALNMSIKVNMEQAQAQGNFDYAAIEQDKKLYFFFIMRGEQVSRKTVRFYLAMDTVNTFWDFAYWNAKTAIQREHVNRFDYKFSDAAGNYYRRAIDKYQEDLNPVKDRFSYRELVHYGANSNNKFNEPWYIIWMSNAEISPDKQSAAPLIPLCCKKNGFNLADEKKFPKSEFSFANLSSGIYYFTESDITGTVAFQTDPSDTGGWKDKATFNQVKSNENPARLKAIKVIVNGEYCTAYALYYTGDVYPYTYSTVDRISDINMLKTLVRLEAKDESGMRNARTSLYNTDYYKNLTALEVIDALPTETINIGTCAARTCIGIDDVDRSSTRIAKIIQIPVAPVDITQLDNLTTIPGYKLILCSDLARGTTMNGDDFNTVLRTSINYQIGNTINSKAAWTIDRESKLYSSEFYDFKLIYKDVSFPIKLENIKSNWKEATNRLTFGVTKSLGTDCYIKWEDMNQAYDIEYPFEEYFFFSGEEVPQYNSAWLDYLRNGYNYDEHTRKTSNTKSIISGVLSGISTVAGVVNPIAGLAIGAANTFMNSKADYLQNYANETYGSGKVKITPYDTDQSRILQGKASPLEYKQILNDLRDTAPYAKEFADVKRNQFLGSQTSIGSLVLQQGINAASSAVSSFMQINSNNKSFQNNIVKQQSSTTSITSSSAYDIQPQTKVWLVLAYPRTEIREQIARVFHYTGYSHPVQAVPDFTSRYWFNFVQCTPVFDTPIDTIHPEYESDFKQRFQAGVTVMHPHKGEYDWEQQYENWETILPITEAK